MLYAPGQPQEALGCNVLLGLELVDDELLQGGGLCSSLCVALVYFLGGGEQESALARVPVLLSIGKGCCPYGDVAVHVVLDEGEGGGAEEVWQAGC